MFNKNSSSFHAINSDYPLSAPKKILYFFLNFVTARIPSKARNLEFSTKFLPRESTLEAVRLSAKNPISPSRFLANAFWDDLNYNRLKILLKDNLRVLDIGCGTGSYGRSIARLSNIESYEGLDLQYHPEWNQVSQPLFKFHQDSYLNISKYFTNQNLIITQSALEHFEEDVLLLEMISSYASSSSTPIISIHIFPSASSLYTFLLHGIRQYGPLQLKKLTKANGNESRNYVFSIGGRKCNFFHFVNITIPQVVLKKALLSKELNPYFESLMKTLRKDSASRSTHCSGFTALISTWNLPKVGEGFF